MFGSTLARVSGEQGVGQKNKCIKIALVLNAIYLVPPPRPI